MKHLFFFPIPLLSILRLGAPKLQRFLQELLGQQRALPPQILCKPQVWECPKNKTTPKPKKRRCPKSCVRFKQTYKQHPKMSKRHKGATPAAWWFAGVTVIPLRHLAEDVIQIRGLGSIHSAISVSTPGAESADR